MKKNSRTKNTLFNFTSSVGGQFLTIVMHFVVRTVFIHTLGKSYLGIGGLFSNILSMLSLTEFGVGAAIIFKLYEPIAHDDHRRINTLMHFYRQVYRLIGLAVTLIGLCLIPFLPLLIKDYAKLQTLHINAVLVFCLYLLKSASSYLFFAYRSAIIKANQKEYLINVVGYFFTIGAGILQIICLKLFANFILYVLIGMLQVIGQNIVCAILSEKMYPFTREKEVDKLDRAEIRDIFKDCAALFLYKLNGVVLKATDNIVLSVFLGLEMVGMYSNYYVFYTTINTLFAKIYNSVSHSLGNLHTEKDKEHEYEIFKSVMLVTAILGGCAYAGIASIADEFVDTWIGSDWLLAQPFSILMGIELFTLCFRVALSKYRTTMGLFQQAKFRPVAGMVINLVVSITLVKYWGICGVLAGTIAADWLTMMWFDPLIIHKYGFQDMSLLKSYYMKYLMFFTLASAGAFVSGLFVKNIFTGHGWFSVIVHVILCMIVTISLIGVPFTGTEEMKYLLNAAGRVLKKIGRKAGRKQA